jgi:hypothetical protein
MKIPSSTVFGLLLWASGVYTLPAQPVGNRVLLGANHTISPALFESLEELSRIVDISYCVGSTGIWKPFQCASRCKEFEGFELISASRHFV